MDGQGSHSGPQLPSLLGQIRRQIDAANPVQNIYDGYEEGLKRWGLRSLNACQNRHDGRPRKLREAGSPVGLGGLDGRETEVHLLYAVGRAESDSVHSGFHAHQLGAGLGGRAVEGGLLFRGGLVAPVVGLGFVPLRAHQGRARVRGKGGSGYGPVDRLGGVLLAHTRTEHLGWG